MSIRKVVSIGALMILGFHAPAFAGIYDCQNVYVRQIRIFSGNVGVIFADSLQGGLTSYYAFLGGLPADTQKAMLSLLYLKKVLGEPLRVKTDGGSNCGIAAGGTNILELQSDPPYF